MNSLVIQSERGTPVTTSLLVAEKFGKDHKHVLTAIQNLVAENSAAKFFHETSHVIRGRNYPMFLMTRDGFSLLVMGFTGDKALQFKIEFINAFNKMEALLKSDDYILSKAMNIMQQRIEMSQATIKLQAKELQAAAPKVEYFDTVLQAENTHTITTIAKELGMSGKELNKQLKARGVVYFQDGHWVPYAKYQGLGYTKTRTHVYEVIENNVTVKRSSISTVWTEKGREFIHGIFKMSEVTI